MAGSEHRGERRRYRATVSFHSESVSIERSGPIATVWLDRPEHRNAISSEMFDDIGRAMAEVGDDADARVVVVAARGPAFTVGIDLGFLAKVRSAPGGSDAARKRRLYDEIRRLQRSISALEECPKPVIAAVHGYCLGAGIDLITACDIRLAASDAVFSVRETRMALVADLGTLQRLPLVVGHAVAAEMVLTGADIDAERALAIGLVSRVSPDQDHLLIDAAAIAEAIAANSPLAVQGAKSVMRESRRRSIAEGLEHVALWNAAYLESSDLVEAITAFKERRPPEFRGE